MKHCGGEGRLVRAVVVLVHLVIAKYTDNSWVRLYCGNNRMFISSLSLITNKLILSTTSQSCLHAKLLLIAGFYPKIAKT